MPNCIAHLRTLNGNSIFLKYDSSTTSVARLIETARNNYNINEGKKYSIFSKELKKYDDEFTTNLPIEKVFLSTTTELMATCERDYELNEYDEETLKNMILLKQI